MIRQPPPVLPASATTRAFRTTTKWSASIRDAKSADARADVYSLGMTAVFAYHGHDLPTVVLSAHTSWLRDVYASSGVHRR